MQAQAAADATKFEIKHYALFKKRRWTIIECGEGGDCFFHSVLMINKVHEYRCAMRRTHMALRKEICTYFDNNRDSLMQNPDLRGMLAARPKSFMTRMAVAGCCCCCCCWCCCCCCCWWWWWWCCCCCCCWCCRLLLLLVLQVVVVVVVVVEYFQVPIVSTK